MLKAEAIARYQIAEEKLAEIRRLHRVTQRHMFGELIWYCVECDRPWMCETRKIIDE